MSTNVNYNSLMAIPSDYDNNDGTLDLAINLVPENAALKPIQTPGDVYTLANNQEKIIGMHDVVNQTNIFFTRETTLCWGILNQHSTSQEGTVIESIGECVVNDFSVIGNTVILATSKGIRYYLWSFNKYIPLGERPPFIPISFGMVDSGEKLGSATITVEVEGLNSVGALTSLHNSTNTFFATFNKLIADKITSKGRFYQPFFVRYAYRLVDGNYWWCSSPILMLPSVEIPKAVVTNFPSNGGFPNGNIETSFDEIKSFDMMYNIMDNPSNLKNWSDLISGIDVFVSPPIYTYDADKDFVHVVIQNYRTLLNKCAFFDMKEDPSNTGNKIKGNVLSGVYATDKNLDFLQHYVDIDSVANPKVWNINPREDVADKIQGQVSFYKYASLSLEDLEKNSKMFASFSEKQLYAQDLSNLASRPELKDDYLSWASLSPYSLYSLNGRVNIGGADFYPSEPHPINAVCHPSGQFTGVNRPTQNILCKVWIKSNGQKVVVEHRAENFADRYSMNTYKFPYWIYYPNPNAYKMEIGVIGDKSTQTKIIRLKQHPFLNGAYFFKTTIEAPDTLNPNPEEEKIPFNPIHNGAKVYTSEVNNPFIFKPDKINTIGAGNAIIKALASANKPLSQGQFGAFPIYAFTSEGVWALTISESGAIASKQPIIRDVALSKDSILQLDDSVLFATDKGIMEIQGSDAVNITYPVLADGEFDITTLPSFDKILNLSMLNLLPKDVAQTDAYSYLCGCRMVYDYRNARVIVFNPNKKVALVYSLKSRMWGQMYSNFDYPINSYPEALVVNNLGDVIDFSFVGSSAIPICLLTRPFALGDSDVFKTINAIIQRGRFNKDNVKQILYGSNDLYNWQIVWSSDNAYMSGFSGEPYKSFRLAVVGKLDLGDALSRFSVDYRHKQTNKLR